jgi:hypothetical protein
MDFSTSSTLIYYIPYPATCPVLPVALSRTGVIYAAVFVYPQDCKDQCADTTMKKRILELL